MSESYGIDSGALILHRPHDADITVRIETKEDVSQYLKDSSGYIAFGNKKERIQQATNLKSIICWLMNDLKVKE